MTLEEFEFINAFVKLSEEEVINWHGRASDFEKIKVFDLMQEYKEQLLLKNTLLDDYKITDLSDVKAILKRIK